MSQYLRGSRTVAFGPVKAQMTFGEERLCGRATFIVHVEYAPARREWKRACESLGIVAHPVVGYGEAVNPHTGESQPRTVAYSCQGEIANLKRLMLVRCVESIDWREAAVPRNASPPPCIHSRRPPERRRSIDRIEKYGYDAAGNASIVGMGFLDRKAADKRLPVPYAKTEVVANPEFADAWSANMLSDSCKSVLCGLTWDNVASPMILAAMLSYCGSPMLSKLAKRECLVERGRR